jgi:hypothetical protein
MFSHHASFSSLGHYRLAVKTSWFRTLLPKITHHTGLKGLWIHDCPAHKDTPWSRPIHAMWNLIQTCSLPSRRCLGGLDLRNLLASTILWITVGIGLSVTTLQFFTRPTGIDYKLFGFITLRKEGMTCSCSVFNLLQAPP